jgi:protein-disulfide isomerase
MASDKRSTRPPVARGGRARQAFVLAGVAVAGLALVTFGVLSARDSDDATHRADTTSTRSGAPTATPSSGNIASTPATPADPADPAASEDPGLAHRSADDPMAMGAVDAPVAIVEYADFRCPFCAKFARDTLPKLVAKYVDTGLVRYEFRDLPFFGDESVDAAVGGRAAALQGRFWEYLHAVYDNAPETGHPEMPRSALLAFAEQAGVPDMNRFGSDLDNNQLRATVTTEGTQGQSLGVDGVPFFVIDNVAVSGAQPLSVFEQIIDKRLAAHGVDTKD